MLASGESRRRNSYVRVKWLCSLWCGLCSVAAGFGICILTGLIPGWGLWYSANTAYRRQTEAFLSGTLALDNDPRMLGYDMAWADGGVQQVWGLGVPAWRLPFELFAKAAGQPAFPDRLALAAALILVCYLLLRLASPLSKPERLAGGLLLILFPPFVTLCRTNFDVYEEAQAYTYLTGLVLFGATLVFVRRPTNARYAILGLLSGLAAFVRPTLFAYGFASTLLAWFLARRERFQSVWVAPLLFVGGCALLFLTNHLRFGSGLEFGHRLNVNVFVPMMYATRFENPVAAAPLLPRITELFSFLFLTRTQLHCCDGYLGGILPGQAPVIRWRDMYFSTYDLSFAAAIVTAWGASLLLWWRKRAAPATDLIEIATMGMWSFLSAIPLFLLYLYYPVMSSRYMLDFAPAFASAFWVLIHLFGQFVKGELESDHRLYRLAWIRAAAIFAFGSWWVFQVYTARIFPETGGRVIRAPMLAGSPRSPPLAPDFSEYSAGMDIGQTRIPFNGYGWDRLTGRTGAMLILFFRSPGAVELEVRPVEGVFLDQQDWEQVRVRVGLDPLVLTSSLEIAGGRRLTFTRRSRPADQSLLEVTFVALASPNDSLGLSKFRLERVRVR